MDAFEQLLADLNEHLKSLGAVPGVPVNLYDVGPHMIIKKGHSQDAVVNALYYLEQRKLLEIGPGNRITLTRPLREP